MSRLIIHAGFPKAGSSSIQSGIGWHIETLASQGFYIFGKDMAIDREGAHPGLPIWFIEGAAKDGRSLTELIANGIAEAGPDATLILTSENLDQLHMPALFTGLPGDVDVSVIFYMRPQTDWIPSAWKQWASKTGLPLAKFVDHCIIKSRPTHLASIEAWQEALPNARIIVRPFFKDVMVNGNPAEDFFSLIGFEEYETEFLEGPVNPSLDYSLLHVLMRNGKELFDGIHDLEIESKLLKVLPDWAKAPNAPMLSDAAAARIEEHFRAENKHILRTYCEIEDVEGFYADHYTKRPSDGASYMEMDENEILVRCFRILVEALGIDRAAAALGSMLKDWSEE